MSNEFKDWRRDFVIENMPEGWEIEVNPDDPFQEELLVKGSCILTIYEAYQWLLKGQDTAEQI